MENPENGPIAANDAAPEMNAVEDAEQQDQNDRTEAHLKKALSSWNAEHNTRTNQLADTRLVPEAAVAIKAEKAARRPSRARVAPAPATPEKKQPFRMSYDGSSINDYVQTLLAKGSR